MNILLVQKKETSMRVLKTINLFVIVLILLFTSSCTKIRDSAGATRKTIDEFQSFENPPLVIPPDFTLVPPEQLEEKNIENVENELAQEILFGLDNNESVTNQNSTVMTEILSSASDEEVSSNIRKEIDEEFANEKNADAIFNVTWENEVDVLDAIKESERIRNQKFNNESIAEGEVSIKKEKIKVKKKKRFIFF
tara:strand:+ start:417 stop:1001 length:585 start_codon:yes stop_codon:yes gene_type:complete